MWKTRLACYCGRKSMFKKVDFKSTIISAVIAAVLFCVPVVAYISSASYRQSWLLYLGSFLFLIVIWVHTMLDNKKRDMNESTVAMVFASHMATIAGVIVSCLLCFILLVLLVPGYLEPGTADKTLVGEPANIVQDKTDGLSLDVFIAATIINFSVGSFAGIILPFYTKRNQTKDPRQPTPLQK